MTTRNEDRFTAVNPDELSPELQQVYKMLQRDYTQKRQQDAETARVNAEKASAYEQQLQQLSSNFESVKAYARNVEDNNAKWQEWYKYLEQSGGLDPGKAGRVDGQAAASAAAYADSGRGYSQDNSARMSATDRELLQTNRDELTPKQIETFDKYFLGKYGSTFQGLTNQVGKLQQTLGYTLQLNELYRTKGKEFDVDPKRVVDAAAELNTDKLDKAFEFAYRKEIEDKKKTEWLDEARKQWDAERSATALEGITRQRTETFYTTPENQPKTYEEVDQQVAEDYARNPQAVWNPPS